MEFGRIIEDGRLQCTIQWKHKAYVQVSTMRPLCTVMKIPNTTRNICKFLCLFTDKTVILMLEEGRFIGRYEHFSSVWEGIENQSNLGWFIGVFVCVCFFFCTTKIYKSIMSRQKSPWFVEREFKSGIEEWRKRFSGLTNIHFKNSAFYLLKENDNTASCTYHSNIYQYTFEPDS